METKQKQKKIKPLLPSLRERKRFIVFEIESNQAVQSSAVEQALYQQYRSLFGTFGLADAGILMLKDKFDATKMRGIIRVNHQFVDDVKASFCFMKHIQKEPITMRSIGMSGILRKAEKKFLHQP